MSLAGCLSASSAHALPVPAFHVSAHGFAPGEVVLPGAEIRRRTFKHVHHSTPHRVSYAPSLPAARTWAALIAQVEGVAHIFEVLPEGPIGVKGSDERTCASARVLARVETCTSPHATGEAR